MPVKKAVKSEEKAQVVRNKVEWTWVDDDDVVQTYTKLLKRPKGKEARKLMPTVLQFMGEMAELGASEQDLEDIDAGTLLSQLGLIQKFWEDEMYEEKLFPFILQIEGAEEQRIYDDELTMIEIINSVATAAQYLIEESFSRPEVQEALKKSDGGEQKAAEGEKAS